MLTSIDPICCNNASSACWRCPNQSTGRFDAFMDLDQPPVGVRVVIARGLPDHPQPVGKSHQPDDRRFIGCSTSSANELLGLTRLNRQPDLATQGTHCLGGRHCLRVVSGIRRGNRVFRIHGAWARSVSFRVGPMSACAGSANKGKPEHRRLGFFTEFDIRHLIPVESPG